MIVAKMHACRNLNVAESSVIENPRRILYINVSRIGDTLLMTPAVRAVAVRWPEAKIDLLAHPKREEVLRFLPFVTQTGVITKHRARFKGYFGGKHYQLAFVSNFDKPLVEYALRVADRVVAFHQGDADLDARLFRSVEHPPSRTEHAVDTHLRLPAAIGIRPAGKALAYVVAPEEALWADRFLTTCGATGKWPVIGLQVASFPTKAYRDWPLNHFIDLCRRIRVTWPRAHFLIFGGKLEQARTSALAESLGTSATLCAGKLSLRETASLMNRIDLYVGVDTGPTHIMGALHRPMVALYHGYSPSRCYGPLDHPCLYAIDHPLVDQDCLPEALMADIEVDSVWQSVQRALAEHPER